MRLGIGLIIGLVAGLVLGWFLAIEVVAEITGCPPGCEKETGRAIELTSEMAIIDPMLRPLARLPAGTVLHGVSDPFGDRTSLFKLYLQTQQSDDAPFRVISVDETSRGGKRVFYLMSRQWLSSQEQEDLSALASPK